MKLLHAWQQIPLEAGASLLLAFLGVFLIQWSAAGAFLGALVLLVMPGVIGMAAAMRLRGIYAWCWAVVLVVVSLLLADGLIPGRPDAGNFSFLAVPMFVGSVLGVIVGILVRHFLIR